MLNKTLIDDFGTSHLCRKWYQKGPHVIHRTGGEMVRRETLKIGEYYDDEQGFWWVEAVWADSPESGPRMEYPY